METTNKITNKSWLQRLKEESWEAELLVSAIAIFGAFKLFDIINWSTNFFIDILNPKQYIIGFFIVELSLLAVSILVSMFLIHFFLRAYWIGLVGLNSVFPDYSIKDSAYSKIYTKKILSILPKLKDSIQKVDELCSVIFSVAFTVLLMYVYLSFFISIYLLVFNLLSNYIPNYILLIPALIISVFLMLQLIITLIGNLKSNREKEKLQIILFKINKVTSLLLFGPFYKPILQVSMIFGSNFKKKKSLVYLVLSFLFVSIFVFGNQIKETNLFYLNSSKNYFSTTVVYASFYKDGNKNNTFLLTPEIESDKVESDVIKVFIPVYKFEKKLREQSCNSINDNLEKGKAKTLSNDLNCYKKVYQILINGKKVEVDFLRLNAHDRTNQFGLISYLDISNIKKGIHTIEIKKEFENSKLAYWKIPFYKVK